MTVNASTLEGEVEASLNYVYRVREVTENEVNGAVSFENLIVEGKAIGDLDPRDLSQCLRSDRMESESTYRVAKDGTVHKMELNLTNCIVPMAGPGLVYATIIEVLK